MKYTHILDITSNLIKYCPISSEKEIKQFIEEAHNGFQETIVKRNGIRTNIRNLQSSFVEVYWANMHSDVLKYLENDVTCYKAQSIKEIKIYKPIISA